MGDTILLRRGTAANLPDLQEGEPGFATDNEGFYIGDATGTAESASYIGGGVYVDALQYEPNTYTQATIQAALTAIGTVNKTTLLLRPGTWVISSNADWSAYTNVTFKIVPGAVISHGAFTINIPYFEAGLYQVFDGTGLITASRIDKVEPHWWGLSSGGVAATNTAALNRAFACAGASGSGGVTVHIPGGAYSTSATITTTSPFYGDGPQRTKIFPDGQFAAFDVTLQHGVSGNLSIDFVNAGAATTAAIGMKLRSASQCRFESIIIWRGYQGIYVHSTFGDGYIWMVDFDHVITSGLTDYAFYISSSSDSTTLAWHNCHVYGQATAPKGKGWYVANATSVVLSNSSMDYGDGAVDGSVMFFGNGHNLFIDTFHLESFTHLTGGLSSSPIVTGMSKSNIENIFYASFSTDVGAGNDGYRIRSAYPAHLDLGSVHDLAGGTVSGTRYEGYLESANGGIVRQKTLLASSFKLPEDTSTVLFTSNIFNKTDVQKQLVGAYVTVDTNATTILNVPARGNGNDSGLFWVHGENVGTGLGFVDLIAVVAARSGATVIGVISSQNSGATPARTYSWDNTGKNIKVLLASSTSSVIAGGFALISP